MDKVLVTGLLVAASVITVIILFGVFRTSIQESGNSATGMQGQVALEAETGAKILEVIGICLLYTSPSPRDKRQSRMPSSA